MRRPTEVRARNIQLASMTTIVVQNNYRAPNREIKAGDREHARGRLGNRFVVATEEPANDLADYQPDREGAQHRYDRIGIESADHCALKDEADERKHERRSHDPQP